jgi:glycosyltransferase involved in cell wall biosynthesis
VSVGWLRWLKGYEYALLAVAELAGEGVPVTLDILGGDPPPDVGEGSERARILHSARALGLEDRVRLRGHVEPGEVVATLQRSDALLHASLSEGLPNVVLEAMACGLPVVATDVGGTREAVRDGVDGFVVPSRDPRAAAAALRTLWQDRALRERMGRSGRERVEAEFTLERLTDQWVELYERVARDG